MKKTAINVKIEHKVKKQAQKIAENLGLTLSSLINVSLKEIIRTKEVHLHAELELTDWAKKELAAAERDAKKGYISPSFATPEEGLRWLNDPEARYANGKKVRT